MNRIAAVVAGLSLAFVGTSTTFAGTIDVPGNYASIQDAINASVNGDVINIAAGTYNEHSLNPGGKAITIQGTLNGDGTLATTIDAQQGGSVFVINSGEGNGTVIKDLVITGGSGTVINSGGNVGGGGFYCLDSSPSITNCTITDNGAQYGGGLFLVGGSTAALSYCQITTNAANFAGGIYCSGSNPTLSNSLVCENASYQIYGPYTNVNNSSCVSYGCNQCDVDDDGDGIPNWQDPCDNDPDNDIDGDGVCGDQDQCPGYDDNADADGDGTPDDCDGCPDDPNKSEPGNCGCGVAETTTFGDLDCDGDYDIDDIYAGMDSFGIDNGPTGACCSGSGCHELTEAACTGMGGTWLGEGGSCDDCAPTCQGDANADGVVDVFDLLKIIDGWGACP